MRWAAVLQMLVGAVMISTSAPWVRVAEVGPSTSGFYRMLIGGVGLIILGLIQRRRLWSGWSYTLALLPVAVFFALDLFFWHRSILYVGPGLATILANFQVFILAFVGWLFFRERIGLSFLSGLILAFAGVWLLVGVDWSLLGEQYRLGIGLGLLTAVAYSSFILLMRRIQSRPDTLSPLGSLAVMSIICAIILGGVVLFEGGTFAIPNQKSLFALLAYGLMCQVFGWLMITKAMPQMPASLIGLFLLLQPALSLLWDVVFFNRPTDQWDLVGAVCVLVGIYMASERGIQDKTSTDQITLPEEQEIGAEHDFPKEG